MRGRSIDSPMEGHREREDQKTNCYISKNACALFYGYLESTKDIEQYFSRVEQGILIFFIFLLKYPSIIYQSIIS